MSSPAASSTAAFFDVDNTVMRGTSIFQLARGLHQRGFLTIRDIVRFAWQQVQFLARGENLAHVADVQSRALAFVAGHSVAELTAIGEQIYDERMADRIWPETMALAQAHLDAGQQVWLVTATPVEVANVIARRLGLTGALGTVAEQVDGVYTGRLVGEPMHGRAKAEAVLRLAEEAGLDLADCAGYSDSSNDLPLLSLLGHPHAVNPDARLRAHARAKDWPVHDFRSRGRVVLTALPVVALVAAVAGAVLGALAVTRRRARRP